MPKCELTEVKNASGKTQLSIVFAGHVDHGKSTTVGHLLYQLGQFSEKDVQRMEQTAKRAGKATFHFAWLLDQSDEERRRGVTIDSGIHAFETGRHTVAILDAPGHEQFIENMASSSAQADVAVLIISGKPDELAVGIEHNTRKHVQILKRIGISRLIVAVNKMDAVGYSEEAFKDACRKVEELLVACKFSPKEDVVAYLPISGLAGINLAEAPDATSCPELAAWYKAGPSLLQVIDGLDPVGRMHKYPLRFVVHDVNAKGTLSGKVLTGSVAVGDSLVFLPSNCKIGVRSIEHSVTGAVKQANAGDAVDIITSSDVSAISVGNIGCPQKATAAAPHCLVGTVFEATIQTYGQNAKAILPGHSFVMMVNGVQVQARIRKLLQKMDMATGTWSAKGGIVKMIPRDVQGRVLIEVEYPIPFERADDCIVLAKFLMKQELNIVGGGVIEELADGAMLPTIAASANAAAA